MTYSAMLYHPDSDSTLTPAFVRNTEAEARKAVLEYYIENSEDWASSIEEARESVQSGMDDQWLVVVVSEVQW